MPSATDYGHDTLTRKFAPNLFIDIQKFEKDKISALQAYSQEMKQYPNFSFCGEHYKFSQNTWKWSRTGPLQRPSKSFRKIEKT